MALKRYFFRAFFNFTNYKGFVGLFLMKYDDVSNM